MFYRKLISWYFAIKQPILNTRHKCWNQIKSRGWAGGWVGVKNSKFLPLFWKYAYIIQISPPSPWVPGSKAYAYVCIRYIYILFMYKYVLLSIPWFFFRTWNSTTCLAWSQCEHCSVPIVVSTPQDMTITG